MSSRDAILADAGSATNPAIVAARHEPCPAMSAPRTVAQSSIELDGSDLHP